MSQLISDCDGQNLIVILSDQHTRQAIGAMGHKVVKTPNLDRLADSGTLFRNAYCNAPICVPSRATLATGRYAFEIEKWDNCKPYNGSETSWGHRLASQGHMAASIGKLHFRSEEDDNGFDPELLPLHVVNGIGNLFTICRNPLPVAKKFASLIRDAGAGNSSYIEYDRDIINQAINWIREYGLKQEKPWVLFVSLVCPHPPWIAPPEFFELYSLKDIDLPRAYCLDERPLHPGLEDFRHFLGIKDEFEEEIVRRVVATYYGMISYLDDNIGKLLTAVNESSLKNTTRFLYTSDHGESMGQKGLFSKQNMFEESVGIPMILAGADIPKGHVCDAPVQLIDVFPTVMDCTGVTPDEKDKSLQGTSLISIANGKNLDRTIFSEQHCAGASSAVYMVRRGPHKLVKYMQGYPSQFYDLESDPLELIDLGSDPNFENLVADLEKNLRLILDPEAIDKKAKNDQWHRLKAAGGIEKIISKGSHGYTPAPGENPE